MQRYNITKLLPPTETLIFVGGACTQTSSLYPTHFWDCSLTCVWLSSHLPQGVGGGATLDNADPYWGCMHTARLVLLLMDSDQEFIKRVRFTEAYENRM